VRRPAQRVCYVPIADIGHRQGRQRQKQVVDSLFILEIVPFLDEALAVF